jgi:AcrR family transcriptional regulator
MSTVKNAKKKARSVPRKDQALATRERILDAAEELFALRGFYGVSIRDITKKADVQLALANYHFGSKLDLYAKVIDRRGPAHAAHMQACLDKTIARARGGRPEPAAVIEAFCSSIFDRMLSGDVGWRRYIQLLSRAADAPQEESFLAPVNHLLDPVVMNYVRAMRMASPPMTDENFYASFYFLQAGLVYILSETGGIDRLSNGACRSSDFASLLPRMVRYFAAGFRSLSD